MYYFVMPKNKQSVTESNLIKFLKMLSKEEMKEFAKFVNSPFHNNRNEVMLFFEEVRKFHPSFNHKNFSKEAIYSKLYPRKKYDDDVMRRISSSLFKLGEEFISYKYFRNDEFSYEKNLLDFYSFQNDDKFFWKQFEKISSLMEHERQRSAKYFQQLSIINEKESTYMLKDDPSYKKSGYEKQLSNLWKYFLIEISKISSSALVETKYFSKHYEIRFVDALLKMAEDSNFMNDTAVEIYYYILKLQTDDANDEIFYKAKNLIESNITTFDKYEGFNICTLLMAYCSSKKLKKGSDFTRMEFEIAKIMAENDLLTATGVIDPGWFLGVFFRALNAKEIFFAEKFIEDNKEKLKLKDKEQIINHAYACLAMDKKEYDKALHYLSFASYKTLNDKATVNVMRLQIYYDASMHEQFFYAVDSFKHLLDADEHVSKDQVILFKNFIAFLTKLYRVKLREINIPSDELINEIKNSTFISRAWLVDKVKELDRNN